MKVLQGMGIGLVVGLVGIAVLLAVYNAGRRSAESEPPTEAPAAAAVQPEPAVAPAPQPPPMRSPVQRAMDEVVAEIRRLEALDPATRAAELETWAPMNEPPFVALERGTDAHVGRRSCYRGTVEEIHDVSVGAELRVALRSYGQDVIYVVAGTRPADDVVARTRVRVCGIHMGSHSYVSQAGWNITLPLLGAVLVERRR